MRRGAWIAYGIGFALLHLVLDFFLGLPAADLTGLTAFRLLEIFLLWAPVVFLAAFFGFGLPRPLSPWLRVGILGGYAAILVALSLLSLTGGTPVNCQEDPDATPCVAQDTFYLLLRFAPIPAAVFLFANGRHGWSMSRCLGFTLLFFALWRAVYFSFPDLLIIAAGGAVLGPTPTEEWYRSFFLKVLWDVFYPVLGLLFFFHRVPFIHRRPAWGRELESLLRPLDAWVRRSVFADAAWGALFFSLNLAATLFIVQLLQQSPTADVGDDSRVYDLLTLDQVFILAIVAGVGEELVYRGILQGGLQRLLGSGPLRSGLAILVQSVVFAIVHSGYADLDHLILPLLFGLLAGFLYRVFGILTVIVIHVEIDVFAFGAAYAGIDEATGSAENPAMIVFLSLLFLVNLAVGIVALILAAIRWWEGGRRMLALVVRA